MILLANALPGALADGGSSRVIEGMPFFPQEDNQCGPASLATVLNYFGVQVSPDEIAREIYSKSARGTLTLDMVLYATGKGLSASQYRGNIYDLKSNIDAGYPVIVMVDLGFLLFQKNHFMVVKGYNEDGLIVNSGTIEGKLIPERDFIRVWKKTAFWTLLVRPKK